MRAYDVSAIKKLYFALSFVVLNVVSSLSMVLSLDLPYDKIVADV